MKPKLQFVTSCVNSTGEAIHAMIDAARDVTFQTFCRHVSINQLAHDFGYSVGAERGLHLKDDFAVSFHRSVYKGQRCYYMRHSAIEYIFQ